MRACVRACVLSRMRRMVRTPRDRAGRRTSHLYQLLELLVDQVLEAMDPHLVRAIQVGAAPQSGPELGVGAGLGAGAGAGLGSGLGSKLGFGFSCALTVVFFCMSHTNLVMSRVSSFSSWSCSASTKASVKKTEEYTVAREMLWAARRTRGGVGGLSERRGGGQQKSDMHMHMHMHMHMQHVHACACACAYAPRVCMLSGRARPEATALGRSRGGSGRMHAASAKRSPSEAGAGRGAGWPHREADDPAPRQGAAQRIGTATPWRFVRLAWLAWGWRGAGVGPAWC